MIPFHLDHNDLPAADIVDQVNRSLHAHPSLIITAPPGAGKSTLLPLTILQGLKGQGKVLMLEPRRLAARQIAERMAEMIGEPVGRTVGYRIRFDNKVSTETQIEVLTEGILTRRLIQDPMLEGIAAVIFDEYHERSLTSDVALALTRQVQQIIRPDLRIVLMSATIDTDALSQQLDAPVVQSEGRMYPVEIRRTDEELIPLIRRSLREHEGDILVFLPGEAEIRQCYDQLVTKDEAATASYENQNVRICPLYGMLSTQEQHMAIAPSQPGQRKVVLATPIAETSLTIQGVRVVIDSGLCRRMVYNPLNSLSHLETVQISTDMATQRMGRAGRVAPGICYRMWNLASEHRMETNRTPEILEADLAPMMLDIAAWGESDVLSLPWVTPPPSAHVTQSAQLLQLLGAIDTHGRITAHGRQLAALPCHPRIAQMLLMANTPAERWMVCQLAAILEEKDPMVNVQHDANIHSRLSCMTRRMKQIAEQYARMIHAPSQQPNDAYLVDMGRYLASAYPERIAKAEPDGCGRYRLANGNIASVNSQDELSAHDWLAIASVNAQNGGGRIYLAAPLDPRDLTPLLYSKENVSWDNKRGTIVAQREYRIGTLVVRTEPIKGQDTAQMIGWAAQRDGRSMFSFDDKVQNLQRRLAAVASWHPELDLPDTSTEALLQAAPQWAPLYVGKATTTTELRKVDLCTVIWGLLSYEQQLQVDQLAPSHIQMPTGSRIQVEYRQGAEQPILRVRLQECFGMVDTPRLDNGLRPVLMELLSPGFKPVQLTQDLRNFWQDTYFEVRKELRRRYPKHAWPDNPLESEPTRTTVNRLKTKG